MHQLDFLSSRARRVVVSLAILLSFASIHALPAAQTAAKKPISIDDYTRWRSINGAEMSPDGKWLVYHFQQMNTPTADAKPVLHLVNLTTNEDVAVPHATGGTFSLDSQWLAYQVDPGAGRAGRGANTTTPAEPNVTPENPAPPTPPAPAPPAPQTPAPGVQTQPGRGAATPPAPPRSVQLRNLATGA